MPGPLSKSTKTIAAFPIASRERHRTSPKQVKAKAALRESEERFRAIFFQAAVGMAQVGAQGEWLLVNDRLCEILGYTPEELRARTFLEMTRPEDREAALAAMRRLLEGELSLVIERGALSPQERHHRLG